jgi:hypothetical protein
MTENAIQKTADAKLIEQVLIGGDLSKLTPEQRMSYYMSVCESVGLNPLTKPFEYITLNGRLTLYARKDATDQVRDKRKVNITKLERERMDSIYTVTAYAQTADGRQDSSIGAVNIENLKGDALANAVMKAETKAKRRVTLSICGLGMLDETELETIPNIAIVDPGSDKTKSAPAKQTPRPEFALPEIDLDAAMELFNSKGERYGDLSSETLSHMTRTIMKTLRENPSLSEDDKNRYHKKLAACKVILQARANDDGQNETEATELPFEG